MASVFEPERADRVAGCASRGACAESSLAGEASWERKKLGWTFFRVANHAESFAIRLSVGALEAVFARSGGLIMVFFVGERFGGRCWVCGRQIAASPVCNPSRLGAKRGCQQAFLGFEAKKGSTDGWRPFCVGLFKTNNLF